MDKAIINCPGPTKGLAYYVNAAFAGGCASGDHVNPKTLLLYTGFVISHVGCPIYWCHKLQSRISLNTTEAAYISPF